MGNLVFTVKVIGTVFHIFQEQLLILLLLLIDRGIILNFVV